MALFTSSIRLGWPAAKQDPADFNLIIQSLKTA
jgi:tetratricopeptide (TPR) repeat protein